MKSKLADVLQWLAQKLESAATALRVAGGGGGGPKEPAKERA